MAILQAPRPTPTAQDRSTLATKLLPERWKLLAAPHSAERAPVDQARVLALLSRGYIEDCLADDLRRLGCRVAHVRSIEEALAVRRSYRPTAEVLDVNLFIFSPRQRQLDVDGLLTYLASSPTGAPGIVLSRPNLPSRQRARLEGAVSSTLPYPPPPVDLYNAVAKASAVHAMTQQLIALTSEMAEANVGYLTQIQELQTRLLDLNADRRELEADAARLATEARCAGATETAATFANELHAPVFSLALALQLLQTHGAMSGDSRLASIATTMCTGVERIKAVLRQLAALRNPARIKYVSGERVLDFNRSSA